MEVSPRRRSVAFSVLCPTPFPVKVGTIPGLSGLQFQGKPGDNLSAQKKKYDSKEV